MQTAPDSKPVHETVLRMGHQRGAPRLYITARYLERAGFPTDTWIEMMPGEGTMIVRRSETPTGKRVNPKRGTGLPVIDLNCELLAQTFGEAKTIYVRVDVGEITLSVHPLETRIRTRPRNGKLGGVFVGGGFLDRALVDAGFESAWGVEINERSAEVFLDNHPEARVCAMSIYEAMDLELPPVELMAIGLPCQGFSNVRTTTDNRGTKRDRTLPPSAHELGDLIAPTLVLLANLNPRTIILENVEQFARSETAFILMGFLAKLDYHVEMRVLDPTDSGGVTARKRTVVVAQTPEPNGTIRDPWPAEREYPGTIADFLDAEVPEDMWHDRTTLPKLFVRHDENKAKGLGFQINPTAASAKRLGTFTAEYGNGNKIDVPMLAHPSRPDTFRYFTMSEGRRIMGVPDDYLMPEGKTYPWELLGQSVHMPTFTEIGRRLRGLEGSPLTIASTGVPHAGSGTAAGTDQVYGLPLFASAN